MVQRDEIASFIKYYDRGDDAAIIQYADCCLKNGFGLKFIHKFFNIPFLKLQVWFKSVCYLLCFICYLTMLFISHSQLAASVSTSCVCTVDKF